MYRMHIPFLQDLQLRRTRTLLHNTISNPLRTDPMSGIDIQFRCGQATAMSVTDSDRNCMVRYKFPPLSVR